LEWGCLSSHPRGWTRSKEVDPDGKSDWKNVLEWRGRYPDSLLKYTCKPWVLMETRSCLKLPNQVAFKPNSYVFGGLQRVNSAQHELVGALVKVPSVCSSSSSPTLFLINRGVNEPS
jgi:hypothetical protein